MNKYQEALDNVKTAPGFMGGNSKYKSNIQSSIPFLEDIAILQELVDKEKPMKVEYFYGFAKDEPYNAGCSKCGYILGKDFIPMQERDKYYHAYCPCCGQKIDWSEEE